MATISSITRLTGLASGLDTDTLVKQLLQADQNKVDRAKQDKQVLQWKMEDYRGITNLLKELKDSYMDVLSTSNMRSSSSYKAYAAVSSNSTAVAATATSSAVAGTHTITVSQLAKAASTTGTSTVSAPLQSTADITDFDFTTEKDFNIQLNGVTKNIKISGTFADADELQAYIQTKVDTAFGANKITVGAVGSQLTFSSADSKIVLSNGATDALAQLKIVSGATNRLNLSAKVDSSNLASSLSGTIAFDINGVSFSFDSSAKTMRDIINEVNSSDAGVTMSYSEATDKFTLTAKTKGAGEAINIANDASGFFGAIGIASTSISNGLDAVFELDGTTITRNDNTFTLDGVSYNLYEKNQTATISVSQDVDKVYNNIKSFVDKYNEIISKINGELIEDRDRDYLPLTDAQKEEMSEDDIEKWEEKSKAGLLRGDSTLSNIVTQMRSALFSSIEGISGGIYSIGIKTGEYYQKGKLIIDEAKLKEAITNKPDLVQNIFSKQSSISYSSTLSNEDKKTRYNESGIVERLFDIVQNNIRTTRDAHGKKGILLEKAGIAADITEFSNYIIDSIKDKDTQIDTLLDRLYNKEDALYAKFTAMEKALSQMNSQSSWIAQQFGG
jgi:flagellar hook-associated protein 2